jgi:hypothetical protein
VIADLEVGHAVAPGPLKLELVEARPFAGGNVGHVYMRRTS